MSDNLNQNHVFYRNPRKFYPKAVRGEGIYIYDQEGNRYIDGSGGAVVVSIGHGVHEVREAMLEQAGQIAFTHGSQFTTQAAIDLADRLAGISPEGLNRVYFLSGGSEAVETAVKLTRQYQVDRGRPLKHKVISRWGSYHGNTLGALALSGHTGRRKYYQPLIQHTPHIPPAYCYRCPFGLEPENCELECAMELEKTILYEGPDSVSAFLAEPVVGATAGALVPKDGYFQKVREICDKYDVLLIVDEVMTGIGRTGKNFAIDHWSVTPDLIVCAKGLGGGYTPIYCVVSTEEIHTAIKQGNGTFVHGHTYSQNPLSCSIANAVLDYIREHNLIERSARMGGVLLREAGSLTELPIVGDVRGLGLFAGIELVKDKDDKTPFDPGQKVSAKVAEKAFANGLITYPGAGGADGVNGDHILLAPPFIITEEQLKKMVSIIRSAIIETGRELGFAWESRNL